MTPNLHLTRPAPGIAQLTLSQPAKRNAINAAMWAGIPYLLNELSGERSARVLIVTGEGAHFASGADIGEFDSLYATPEDADEISAAIADALDAVARFPAPTLAMIRGACVGGGAAIALACDLRFADTTAKFAFTPAKLGLAYPFEDMARLADAVGLANARDLLFSARLVGAKEARALGLVNRLLSPGELENEVMDYAESLLGLSPRSLATTKAMFARYQGGQRKDDAATRALFRDHFASPDFREGYAAFLAKRRPEFPPAPSDGAA